MSTVNSPSRSFSFLLQRPTPAWWTSQKFSLFMHWGLYAVPAFCPVTEADKTCYAEHFWDTSHVNGKRFEAAPLDPAVPLPSLAHSRSRILCTPP